MFTILESIGDPHDFFKSSMVRGLVMPDDVRRKGEIGLDQLGLALFASKAPCQLTI